MKNSQNSDANILPILGRIAEGHQYALPIAPENYSEAVKKFVKEHSLDIAQGEKGIVIARIGTVKELVSEDERSLMYRQHLYLFSDEVEAQKAAAQMFEDMENKSMAQACHELLDYRAEHPDEFSMFNGGMGNSFKADIIVAFIDFFMFPRK